MLSRQEGVPRLPASARKRQAVANADATAAGRDRWIARHRYFYEEDHRYMRFLVGGDARVLDLGCGTGDLLDSLEPAEGVGVDVSAPMVERARTKHPRHRWIVGDVERMDDLTEIEGSFDAVVMSDTVGVLDDCLETFRQVHRVCDDETRLIVTYYSRLWEPAFRLGEWLGLKQSIPPQNWLSTSDIGNLLQLADFEVISREWRVLVPWRLFGAGPLINRYVATLPGIRRLCMRNYLVARAPRPHPGLSASVVVPARNEKGNIEAAVMRLPRFCEDLEIVFVEGGSSDGTWEEIQRVIAAHPARDIKAFKQPGRGKGDAVRKGFSEARGDVLMILDADLTVPPEELPKFYEAITAGRGEFVNGSRLVYPMEHQSMRLLNLVANHVFSLLFSYLLNQRYTDTLCGTKVLRKHHYRRIAQARSYFGDFDPFGDFDLIFGAAKLNLKTAEIPIRYAARTYGTTQISRFAHGWLLLRMVLFAFRKMKAL